MSKFLVALLATTTSDVSAAPTHADATNAALTAEMGEHNVEATQSHYTNLGFGKCQRTAGGDPVHNYHHGARFSGCAAACNNNANCCGYSVSSHGNCLTFNEPDIVASAAHPWGNAHCYFKTSCAAASPSPPPPPPLTPPPSPSSPPPSPSSPPPSPQQRQLTPRLTLDPSQIDLLQKIKEGWCSNWQIGAGGDQHYFTNHTTHAELWERDGLSCFQRCDESPACKQAVFETKQGMFGPQCWLGTNDMLELPRETRATCKARNGQGCQNFCYAKNNWPLKIENIRNGWCPNWNAGLGTDQHYFTNHTTHAAYWERDGASCFARCEAHPECKQAVFETREGYWGPQCWLGTNHVPHAKMSNRPTCQDTPGCENFCYAKMGYGYTEPVEESP